MSSPETSEKLQKHLKRLLPPTPVGKSVLRTSSQDRLNLSNASQTSLAEAGSKLSGSLQANGKKSFSMAPTPVATVGEDSSVTVAVRVRPFNEREQCLEAKQVVWVSANEVVITSKDDTVYRFAYDHCFYWSPDSSLSKLDDQERVYRGLAKPLLDRSFEGYNTCLFAYGQTGSGKSYCIMGEKDAPGVVPQFTKELYERIEQMTAAELNILFKVQVSFYEIFNEKIYDLLASTKAKSKAQLRVREHPIMGPYVEDLAMYVAGTYSDIEHWLNLGNRFRATAATGMNDRSSRSHSVFTILLTQTMMCDGEEHSKVSRINLIDLAGSERSSISLTSGDRLKEGASINRSLHTLGKVISLLSERSAGRRKKVFIPYRDSTLTWLLKDSLGGNSKTTMIATVSPSDIYRAESLSTLRYAQQARTIVNVARINEDPNAQIIRELRQEIEHLRSLLAQNTDPSSSLAEIKNLREQLTESEKLMDQATRTWKDQQDKTEARKLEELERLKREALYADSGLPTLVNLNEDPQLSEKLLYALKEGLTTVGSDSHNDIQLTGVLVAHSHCAFLNENERVTLQPSHNSEQNTYVNGQLVLEVVVLHHGDRVIFGGEYFFRFNHPREVEKGTALASQGGFEFARNEFVQAQTARLEAELEAKRTKEKEEMMKELQAIKDAAQREMETQKGQFQEHLEQLSSKMQEQSLVMQQHQQSEQEAQSKVEELRRRNQLLEEETMEQRHIIRLEQLKMQKEFEEVKEHKSRLMMELEQEKRRLEDDIAKLNKNSVRRQSVKPSATDASTGSQQVLRLAMMLQEANAICKALGKPLTLSREESYDQGEMEVHIRVGNNQSGMVTVWDVNKFELRLDQMRDIYQQNSGCRDPPSSVEEPRYDGADTDLSNDGSSSTDVEPSSDGNGIEPSNDPFSNPSDEWIRDVVMASPPSLSSPLRTTQLCRSLLSSPALSSLTPSSGKILSSMPKSVTDLLTGRSHSGSPALFASPGAQGSPLSVLWRSSYPQGAQPLVRVCRDHLMKILTIKEGPPPSVCEKLLHHVCELRASCIALGGMAAAIPNTPGACPLQESPDINHHVMAICMSLEQLLACVQSQHACYHAMEGCLQVLGAPAGGSGALETPAPAGSRGALETPAPAGSRGALEMPRGPLEQCCHNLVDTISHQTALYCSKLLQGIEENTENCIQTSSANILESLNALATLIGQLSMGVCLLEHSIRKSRSQPVARLLPSDLFSSPPYHSLARPFYRGYRQWCTMVVESTQETIQTYFKQLCASSTNTLPPICHNLQSGTCNMIKSVTDLMQTIAVMQVPIWGLDGSTPDDAPLPALPDNGRVTDMLLCIQEVKKGQAAMFDQGLLVCKGTPQFDTLLAAIKQAVLACSELSACMLSITKGLPASDSQVFVVTIQSLSHDIAHAGKSLIHLVKCGRSLGTTTPDDACYTDPSVV